MHAPQASASASFNRSSAFEQYMAFAATRRIDVRQHLFCEGDPCTHVFHVDEGVVAIYRQLIDGRRHIVEFGLRGDLIRLSTYAFHVFNAQALCAAQLRCLSTHALECEARSDADLAFRLYRAACQELSSASGECGGPAGSPVAGSSDKN